MTGLLKLGLVGTDRMAAAHLTDLLQGPSLPPEQQIKGARVVALWSQGETPEERERAERLRKSSGVHTQVDRPKDLIGIVDGAFITTAKGGDHKALAEPFLQAHIPVCVCAPLAPSVEDARDIVALSESTGTALCSHSPLRYVPEVTSVVARAEIIGPLHSGICTGWGELFTLGVNTVEMLHTVFGCGVEWVHNVHDDEKDVAMVRYADGKTVGFHLMRFGGETFECSYFGTHESGHLVVSLPTPRCLLFKEMVQVVLEMFRTGRHPLSLSHTLEVIAILEALHRSGTTGDRVYLRDLLGEGR